MIRLAMNEMQPALAAFQRAIDLDPECAYALWRRGEIREAMGDSAGGAADKAEALRLDPDIRP